MYERGSKKSMMLVDFKLSQVGVQSIECNDDKWRYSSSMLSVIANDLTPDVSNFVLKYGVFLSSDHVS